MNVFSVSDNVFICFSSPSAVRTALSPEDDELLLDDEVVTPIKQGGIRRKERPTDKGVSWLVKTQYISPISMEAAKMVQNILQCDILGFIFTASSLVHKHAN